MDQNEWLETAELQLSLKKSYYHHHAFEIIKANPDIRDFFFNALNQPIPVVPRIKQVKKGPSRAIEASDLNIQIRKLLKGTNDADIELKLEVSEEDGVFYFATEKSAIGGFDFAILNNQANLISLRNLCFGTLQYANAKSRWEKFLAKNPELAEMGKEVLAMAKHGANIEKTGGEKKDPLIVGEIQFGNWALAYRDFFKVLKADVHNNIDCLIYIVPCGDLERYLSDGIVTYDKTVKIIEAFAKVINVPVWLIGVDVQDVPAGPAGS
jgi:hypothetical protein